jgi:hypothetical protein
LSQVGDLAQEAKVIKVENSFNVEFDGVTRDLAKEANRTVFWLSQCTQPNFLTAIEKMNAVMLGYANEDYSHTQTFNCHKVQKYNAGRVLDLQDMNTEKSISDLIKCA